MRTSVLLSDAGRALTMRRFVGRVARLAAGDDTVHHPTRETTPGMTIAPRTMWEKARVEAVSPAQS